MKAIIGTWSGWAKAIPEGSKKPEGEMGLDTVRGLVNKGQTEVDAWKSLEMAHCALATWDVMLLQRGSQGLGMYEGRNE